MARKLTRYKVNRQFRRNPTRSRVFFPYMLPFQADFRVAKEIDKNNIKEQGTTKNQKRSRQDMEAYWKEIREHTKAFREKAEDLAWKGATEAAHAVKSHVKQEAEVALGTAAINGLLWLLAPEARAAVAAVDVAEDIELSSIVKFHLD